MASTRTPLQPAPFLVALHAVGFKAYAIRYRPGQEELARESIARLARNPGALTFAPLLPVEMMTTNLALH